MRSALLGPSSVMDGPLWVRNGRLACVLAATIPSGDDRVVSLRKDLTDLINIPEHVPVLPNSWVTPVFDFATVDRPWPLQYIYM